MEKGEEFLKNIKPSKVILFIGLWFLIMCLGSAGYTFKKAYDEVNSPVEMTSVKEENQYSCINTKFAFGPIAVYTNNSGQELNDYILFDGDNLFLASIDSKLEDKLKDIIEYSYSDDEDAKEPDAVDVCGGTSKIASDLKKLAVEGYNKTFEDDLKYSEAEELFGYYYIDTSKSPYVDMSAEFVAYGIFGIAGLIMVIIYLVHVNKTKKNLKKYENEMEKIKLSVAAPDTYYDKKAKVYLTKEYLINFATGFDIYDYKDIIWIYPYEMRRNGYVSQKSIYVITSDSKAHIISNLSASKKNSIRVDELYQSMLIKLPDVLHGYTEENKKKAKELYKK